MLARETMRRFVLTSHTYRSIALMNIANVQTMVRWVKTELVSFSSAWCLQFRTPKAAFTCPVAARSHVDIANGLLVSNHYRAQLFTGAISRP
jgi:hypothetical protein